MAHETQHVMDIESVGAIGFYASYGADAAISKLSGGDGYYDAYWERRTYAVADGYDAGVRPWPW